MDAIHAILAVLCIQLGLAAVGWWLSAALLGLSRGPALHWSAFCALALAGAIAGSQAVDAHDAGPLALAAVALMGSFIAVGRGVGQFIGRPLAAWPDAVLFSAVAVIGLVDVTDGMDPRIRSALLSACLASVALRDGLLTWRGLRVEFGWAVTGLVTGPMFASGALFAWRCLRALFWPPAAEQLLMTATTTVNLVVLLVLTTLAALFNLALALMVVMRLVKRLHHLSRHDSLTGLLNRRALLSALEGEQSRVRRGGEGWALLLIDVDHFKRVNDLFGHTTGDAVLCRVAEVLRQSARTMDIVSRTGGEEFCVLAPMTDLHGAALLAERLRQAVSASAERPDQVSVTISIGVALASMAPNETATSAMSRADVALYRAKAAGRDRVEMPPDEELAGEVREPLAV
jgi:diguanylate cyclase (GGDEF)-like protein